MIRFMLERLAKFEDPRSIGEALKGERYGELWRYRVGDYRIICRIEDQALMILMVMIGHRREVHKDKE